MATFSQNQIKDIFVVEALATETNIQDFIADASPLEIQILAVDGASQPVLEDFYFVQKHKDGSFKRSDVIPINQIRYIRPIDAKIPVPRSYIMLVDITDFTVGDVFLINIKIDNWGSRSVENQYIKFGSHKLETGDTANDVATGLAYSLTLNSSKEPVTLFTYTALGPFLIITEVEQEYITGKKQGKPLDYIVENNWNAQQFIVERVINPCSGRNVRDLEYFCKGNVGDSLRYSVYPYNWEEWYDSELSDYCLVDIGYYYQGTGEAVQTSEKEIIVAFFYCDEGCDFVELLEQATGLTIECPGERPTTTTTTAEVTTTTTTVFEQGRCYTVTLHGNLVSMTTWYLTPCEGRPFYHAMIDAHEEWCLLERPVLVGGIGTWEMGETCDIV